MRSLILAAGLVSFLISSSAASEFILKVPVSKLEVVDAASWSKVEEGGKYFAAAQKGKSAQFILPAWWGPSSRPAQGETFILEIDYRDDSTTTFIVSSFGNCANSSAGLSELHRIPGEGTKKWKTAFIPVSSSYLYTGEGNPAGAGKQSFALQVNKDSSNDLVLSELRIRKAESDKDWINVFKERVPGVPVYSDMKVRVNRDDEKAYNAETRAWVKKDQERFSADKINDPAPETAEIPSGLKNKECVPYVRSYMTPVLPFSAPREAEAGAPLKVRMALNEIECTQLGIYANGKDLEKVTLALDAIKDEKGNIPSVEVKFFTMEYALVQGAGGKLKTDAQRIWPLFETFIPSGKSQAFWLTFKTTGNVTKPGKYKGTVSILGKGNLLVSVPLELDIMPVKLLTMEESGLTIGGCVSGLIPSHDIAYGVENNINAINLWASSVKPGMKKVDGKLKLDFTLLNEWMQEAKKQGCQNITYFMGGNPYGFPRTLTIEREIYAVMFDDGGRNPTIAKYLKLAAAEENRDRVLPELRELYGQWVKEVTEYAKANNWPELILTPFDEPAKYTQGPYRKEGNEKDESVIGAGPWIKTYFEDACDLIRKYAPNTRIYGSIHHATGLVFLPKINVFCTNAIHEDSKMGEKIAKAGADKYFWQYSGGGANSDPAKMRYTFGYFFGAFNSRGSLLWAYNWGSRFDTTEGYNWMICWDTPFSVIPNLSYEGVREAWDDRRYIETLKKVAKEKGKEEEVKAFLDGIFKQSVESRTAGGRDTVYDFWSQTKDPEQLNKWRFLIADKIIELAR